MGAPLEGDIQAEGVQPLEWIVEAVRDRLGVPSALYAVLLPEIEPAEIHSGVRHPRPGDETLREGEPDLQILQPQVGRIDRLQRRRLVIPESDVAVRETRIGSVGAIFVPGLPVVEQRRLSPPITPGHAVVTLSEERPLAHPLEEHAEIKPLPCSVQVYPVGVPRREIPQIDDITVLTGIVPVQADLAIAVQVLEPRVADPDVAGNAAEQFVRVELGLGTDQPIEHVAEVRVHRIALAYEVVAQDIGVLAAIVHDLVLGIAERYPCRIPQPPGRPFPSNRCFEAPGLELTGV